jgi:WD40 repeat protein
LQTVSASVSAPLLAVGHSSGAVFVVHATTGERLYTLFNPRAELPLPVTALAWAPRNCNFSTVGGTAPAAASTTTNSSFLVSDVLKSQKLTSQNENQKTPDAIGEGTLVAAYPDGFLAFFHAATGSFLGTLEEPENQIFALDFSPVASLFATAGSDCQIRIYDSTSLAVVQILGIGQMAASSGHSNRIFAVRWHPIDPNVLISAGWDSTIQIWDRRRSSALRSIYQPHVCGESIDFDESGELILAGSHTRTACLTVCEYPKYIIPTILIFSILICTPFSTRMQTNAMLFIHIYIYL